MSAAFEPSRPDGRSDRQVVYDLVQDAEPDTTFTYDALQAALSEGLESPAERSRVYQAVAHANRTLLQERQRCLNVVRGTGYRVIHADEHLPVALVRKDRAQTQLKRGIELLRKCRVGELDENQRKLHEGQLLILGGLYQAVQESERRHARSESLIADLSKRVDQLENQT